MDQNSFCMSFHKCDLGIVSQLLALLRHTFPKQAEPWLSSFTNRFCLLIESLNTSLQAYVIIDSAQKYVRAQIVDFCWWSLALTTPNSVFTCPCN